MTRLHDDKKTEETEETEKSRPYNFYQHKAIAHQFHFYISGVIEEPAQYTEMIHRIRTAGSRDIINIHLNTPGGSVPTGVQLISAMRASDGHIVTHLEGEACSMGALLFLTADEMVVYDDSLLMFHNYSGGTTGKGHELTASIDAINRWYSKLARTVCIPFLTEAELDRIFDGADVWMLSDEVERRLKHMAKQLAEDLVVKRESLGVTAKKSRKKASKKKTKKKTKKVSKRKTKSS